MEIFKDKFGFDINIDDDYISKLKEKMPPIDLKNVASILAEPSEVKISASNKKSRCYYKKFSETRWYKVVVKYIESENEHWIQTGHLTDGIREKEDFNESSL